MEMTLANNELKYIEMNNARMEMTNHNWQGAHMSPVPMTNPGLEQKMVGMPAETRDWYQAVSGMGQQISSENQRVRDAYNIPKNYNPLSILILKVIQFILS
jgi:hypothetical protein